MSGKKLVGIVIGVVIIASLVAVLTISNFYKNNEKQPNSDNWEENKSNSLYFIYPWATIISNSR